MANLFILNIAGITAPVATDKNCNALTALLVERFRLAAALEGVEVAVQPRGEQVDPDDLRAALFTRVAAGEVAAAYAAAELKAIDAQVAAAAADAKQDPPVLLLNGEPATCAEVKRAFRGQDDGMTVEVASLDGSIQGTIMMVRV
jgi:hypothetical protein